MFTLSIKYKRGMSVVDRRDAINTIASTIVRDVRPMSVMFNIRNIDAIYDVTESEFPSLFKIGSDVKSAILEMGYNPDDIRINSETEVDRWPRDFPIDKYPGFAYFFVPSRRAVYTLNPKSRRLFKTQICSEDMPTDLPRETGIAQEKRVALK
jgi:hypothetical protein